jgi:hypothetical protein
MEERYIDENPGMADASMEERYIDENPGMATHPWRSNIKMKIQESGPVLFFVCSLVPRAPASGSEVSIETNEAEG